MKILIKPFILFFVHIVDRDMIIQKEQWISKLRIFYTLLLWFFFLEILSLMPKNRKVYNENKQNRLCTSAKSRIDSIILRFESRGTRLDINLRHVRRKVSRIYRSLCFSLEGQTTVLSPIKTDRKRTSDLNGFSKCMETRLCAALPAFPRDLYSRRSSGYGFYFSALRKYWRQNQRCTSPNFYNSLRQLMKINFVKRDFIQAN